MKPKLSGPRRLPALFISDLHLGTRGCQAELALEVLSRHEADVYYLVGDIIDGWRLSEGWRWTEAHSSVVRHFLERARAGARVVYIPGNHDEFLRRFVGRRFEGVEIVEDAVHVARDGKRYLIAHGDTFDVVIQRSKTLAVLGDRGYRLALAINTALNRPDAPARPALLVVLRLDQAEDQDRRQRDRRFRAAIRGRGAPPRRRRRHLRPYPPPDDARDRRRSPTSISAISSNRARW